MPYPSDPKWQLGNSGFELPNELNRPGLDLTEKFENMQQNMALSS